jgi:catechol 2,3-dioxygenase-like lactoylglutathione lyase family enzyme
MFRIAMPIMGVRSSEVAERFYCGQLGFQRRHAYRPDPAKPDPCWLVVGRDGARIVLSSFPGDGPPGTRAVQIYVDDAAALRRDYQAAGVPDIGQLWDQDWGNLEFSVKDPDGNGLCFAQDKDPRVA